jgi:ankyrin repeat protein
MKPNEVLTYIRNDDVDNLKKHITKKNVNEPSVVLRIHIIFDVCSFDAINCLKYIISQGADVNALCDGGRANALQWLLCNNGDKCFPILINLIDTRLLNQPDDINDTALRDALRHKNYNAAKLLIDRGADITLCRGFKIPNQIIEFIEKRTQTRNIALIIIGIHKFKHTHNPNGKDIIRHIGKHIWSMRLI